jgi:hypothetical protein
MSEPKAPVKWALSDNQRLFVDSATKMNVAPHGLFVDFQFVDKTVQN